MQRSIAITLSAFLVGAGLLGLMWFPALADVNYTQGSGTVIFDITCFSTKHCSAHVPIDSTGVKMTDDTNHRLNTNGNIADGADVNSGTTTDAAATAGSTGTLSAKLRLMTTQLDTLNISVNSTGAVKLVDTGGTNQGTIKAASVPPAPTDTAVVTALRPSTPMTPIVAAASDNHAVVKNGAGVAFSIHASNNSATANYARLYDAGTGFNGCNSATGVIFAFEIPPTNSGFTISLGGSRGIAFTNGLSYCITSGFGLTDTTNATASAIYFNVSYN